MHAVALLEAHVLGAGREPLGVEQVDRRILDQLRELVTQRMGGLLGVQRAAQGRDDREVDGGRVCPTVENLAKFSTRA